MNRSNMIHQHCFCFACHVVFVPITAAEPIQIREHVSTLVSDEVGKMSSDSNTNINLFQNSRMSVINRNDQITLPLLARTPETINFNRLRLLKQ
jgi:hypothetical protein